MANQRAPHKSFVSGWMDKKLKNDTLEKAKELGFFGCSDLLEVMFQRYRDKPFRKPALPKGSSR